MTDHNKFAIAARLLKHFWPKGYFTAFYMPHQSPEYLMATGYIHHFAQKLGYDITRDQEQEIRLIVEDTKTRIPSIL